jgi:hypothetical protein
MSIQTSDLHSLSERLERLEKENRALKRFGIGVLSLLAAALVMGQARPERTVEAEKFVLKDASGRMRGEFGLDNSGTPALAFYDESGTRGSDFREGDLMIPKKEGFTRMSSSGVMISNKEGHIELGTAGLRLKITSSGAEAYGYTSLGMVPSLEHEGVVGAGLTLQGDRGKGFVALNTADGPRLHLEPGMWQGKVLPGGFVDITADGPLVQVADQQGLTVGIGRFGLVEKDTGRKVLTPTASINLLDKEKILWSAPR